MSFLAAATRWTNLFEKYVLSLLFLKIAYDKAVALRELLRGTQRGTAELTAITLSLLVLLFSVFFAINLLANRKPLRNPTSWQEIVIPLMATFLFYGFAALSPYVPEAVSRNLLPLSLQRSAAGLAMLVSFLGYAMAIWSVLYLGRSLSIVVSVRTLARRGPYKYVRHPMYLGYIVLDIGMVIASMSLLAAVFLVTAVVLTVYRARLEEAALCAFSEEYRQYARRTGFLLPALGRLDPGARS